MTKSFVLIDSEAVQLRGAYTIFLTGDKRAFIWTLRVARRTETGEYVERGCPVRFLPREVGEFSEQASWVAP